MIVSIFKTFFIYALVCLPMQKNNDQLIKLNSCSRQNSSVVRQLLYKLWRPKFRRHKTKLPNSCPMHVERDVFHVQESVKKFYRSDLWLCGRCGKAFLSQDHLDHHVHTKHPELLSRDEVDPACLADYCDIFRCDVFVPSKFTTEMAVNNNQGQGDDDNERNLIMRERNVNIYSTLNPTSDEDSALILAPPQILVDALEINQDSNSERKRALNRIRQLQLESSFLDIRSEDVDNAAGTRKRLSTSNDDDKGNTGSSPPVRQDTRSRGISFSLFGFGSDAKDKEGNSNIHNDADEAPADWAEKCDQAEMRLLRDKCEALVEVCVASLQFQLDQDAFVSLKDDLNSSTCSYLTCNQYWNKNFDEPDDDTESNGRDGFPRRGKREGSSDPGFQFGIQLKMFLVVLGCVAAILLTAYYIVWICF